MGVSIKLPSHNIMFKVRLFSHYLFRSQQQNISHYTDVHNEEP